MPSSTSTTPPRQCAAFGTATNDTCGRDTHDTILLGVRTEPVQQHGKVSLEAWTIEVEVPICDQHEDLVRAITEEVEPMTGSEVKHLDGDATVMPTFRISFEGHRL